MDMDDQDESEYQCDVMWKTVISAISSHLHKNEYFHLDSIFKLVLKDLVYEDPGIFPKRYVLSAEVLYHVRARNLWLINQLMYVIVTEEFNSITKTSVVLQKEIMASSLLKHPPFFYDLFDKYIQLLDVLVSYEDANSIPNIKLFEERNYNLAAIAEDCNAVFNPIIIRKENIKNLTIESVLQILSGVVKLIALDKENSKKCADCVLQVILNENLNIKMEGLRFFTEYFNGSIFFKVKEHNAEYITVLLHMIEITISNITTTPPEDVIQNMGEVLISFFEKLKTLNYAKTPNDMTSKMFALSNSIVINSFRKVFLENLISDKSILSIINYMKSLITESPGVIPVNYNLSTLIPLISKCAEITTVMDVVIVKQLRIQDAKLYESNASWQFITYILENSFENLPIIAKEVQKIFHLTNMIDLRYKMKKQCEELQNDSQPNEVNQLKFFNPSVKLLTSIIKKLMSLDNIQTIENLKNSLAILHSICHISDFQTIPKNLQLEIFTFICAPVLHNINKHLLNVPDALKNHITKLVINPENLKLLQLMSLELILNMNYEHFESDNMIIIKNNVLHILQYPTVCVNPIYRDTILVNLISLISFGIVKIEGINSKYFATDQHINSEIKINSKILKSFICGCFSNTAIFIQQLNENKINYNIICAKCEYDTDDPLCYCENANEYDADVKLKKNRIYASITRKEGLVVPFDNESCKNKFIPIVEYYLKYFSSSNEDILINMLQILPAIIRHTGCALDLETMEKWTDLIIMEKPKVLLTFVNMMKAIWDAIEDVNISATLKEDISDEMIIKLQTVTRSCLVNKNREMHHAVSKLIYFFCIYSKPPEEDLAHCLMLMLSFMIQPTSRVPRDASLLATEMCVRNNVTPIDLLNWYKHKLMNKIVTWCVLNYISRKISISNSLNLVTKMFGYRTPKDFIAKHFKIMLAMLTPLCIKAPECEELCHDICRIIHRTPEIALSMSFLTIYPYIYMNYDQAMYNKCIDFILNITSATLYNLLYSDIKRTVSEILVYYHRNPECVVQAFKCLTSPENNTNVLSAEEIADYISQRFLGVLTHFELILVNESQEYSLKRDTLQSLGGIIRLLATNNSVTPFRFKILSVLKTALTITKPDLRKLCLGVFSIFIHSVDIQSLGPLLSNIVLTLECLISDFQVEVNEILRYLIIDNRSLLSNHLPDLFFLNDTKIDFVIKNEVNKQIKEASADASNNFLNCFRKLYNNIKHENLSVRMYALKYLKILFKDNRPELNKLIVHHDLLEPQFEDLINYLMGSCKDEDSNLQVRAGECLGEMGAVEPSFLSMNYSNQYNDISLSIHTDHFTTLALTELCRAHQSAQNTQYVDCFALGIQEILLARSIDNSKPIWRDFSENMRQIMTPLLSSCYTPIPRTSKNFVEPIFGSSTSQTVQEWAYLWSSQMIENMYEDEETQKLLESIKYSIRRSMSILSLFLPYTLLHFLQSSTDDKKELVFKELQHIFNTVLTHNHEIVTNKVHYLKTLNFAPVNVDYENEKSKNTKYFDIVELACKCAKLVFSLFDFLEKWKEQWKICQSITHKNYVLVDQFLNKFDKKFLAEVNLKCGEYARALLYLEIYVGNKDNERLQNELPLLTKIYAELLDVDSLEGITAIRKNYPTLNDSILLNKVIGRHQDSVACFERMMTVEDLNLEQITDMVNCYLQLDQPSTAIVFSQKYLEKYSRCEMKSSDALQLQELQAESLWRLSRFDELEALLDNPEMQHSDTWGVRCGQLFTTFRNNQNEKFSNEMDHARLSVLKLLKNTEVEHCAYQKGYPNIIKLQMLNEFENVQELVQNENIENPDLIKKLFSNWDSRLEFLQPTANIVEPILCLRRILLNEAKELVNRNHPDKNHSEMNENINKYIGKLWIKSTELASKAKMFQQARFYIINAEPYKPKELFIAKAKVFWENNDSLNTFKILESGIEELFSTNNVTEYKNLDIKDRMLYAEATLMLANYNAEKQHIEPRINLEYYENARVANPKAEITHISLAQFVEVQVKLVDASQHEKLGNMLMNLLTIYAMALRHGQEFIYQSMPRVLTIWLDYTAKNLNQECKEIQKKMNDFMGDFRKAVSIYTFYTAFSQLVSRICHSSQSVITILKSILVDIIYSYPAQSLWMIFSLANSVNPIRQKHCTDILRNKRLSSPEISTLINNFDTFSKKLIALTKSYKADDHTPTIKKYMKSLPELLGSKHFSKIILPFQKNMQMVADNSNPLPYPMKHVYIQSVKDKLTVLRSLQSPLKITFVGSDGKDYIFLLKSRDDLRKDFRLMEFNAVVKKFLLADPDARHRRLNIRTYSVLPLNEECGIIEWIHNLKTFRSILLELYKEIGGSMSSRQLSAFLNKSRSLDQKRDSFLNTILPQHPPVFSKWFRRRFSVPHSWYQAKSSYIKTAAVMSMVGYIVGLGDRHGENILLDEMNGELMHVDFDCLFNKGELCEIPEVVPFRLTHNMVDGMGPLGVEGLFRKCCEITLRVLEDKKETLVSVLRPFVYDPLVVEGKTFMNTGRTDENAMKNIQNIEQRLKGFVRLKKEQQSVSLSIEGQVKFLISQATDIDNLASMYAGWNSCL